MEALYERYFATVISRKLAVSIILDKLLSYFGAMNTILSRCWHIDDRTSGNVFFTVPINYLCRSFQKGRGTIRYR